MEFWSMPKIEWFYCRGGWQSCNKTREFLAKFKIETPIIEDARKNILKESDAKKLIGSAKSLYLLRGKTSLHFNLEKEKPDKAVMEKMILGRTGNLRAPAIKYGQNLIIGFNENTYRKIFEI